MSEQRQHLPHQSTNSQGLRKGGRPFTGLQRTQELSHTHPLDTHAQSTILHSRYAQCPQIHVQSTCTVHTYSIDIQWQICNSQTSAHPSTTAQSNNPFTAPSLWTPYAHREPHFKPNNVKLLQPRQEGEQVKEKTSENKCNRENRRGKEKSVEKGDTKWSWLVAAEHREIRTT